MCSSPTRRLRAAVKLTDRYVTDRMRPDKAIDALDEACAHMQASTEYTPRDRRADQAAHRAAQGSGARRARGREARSSENETASARRAKAPSAFERFGAELEALFVGTPEPVGRRRAERPKPRRRTARRRRPITLAPLEADLARQLDGRRHRHSRPRHRARRRTDGGRRGRLGDGSPTRMRSSALARLPSRCSRVALSRARRSVGRRTVRRQGRRRRSADRESARREVQDAAEARGAVARSGARVPARRSCRSRRSQKQIANQEATYKLLGLAARHAALRRLLVKVLTEQIIGYYDPKTKVLYVVKGAPEDYVGHHDHARAGARAAGSVHQSRFARAHHRRRRSRGRRAGGDRRPGDVRAGLHHGRRRRATSPRSFPAAGRRCARRSARAQKTQPVFSSAPMVIQETLLFPYINGADSSGGSRRTTASSCRSTACRCRPKQLMHDAAYFGKQPDVPSEVTLPRDPGHGRREQLRRVRHAAFHLSRTRRDQDRVDPRVERLGRRPLRAREDAGRQRARLGRRCGTRPATRPSSCRARSGDASAVQSCRPRVTGERRHFETRNANDRRRRARDRRTPGRAVRRRARRLEHRTSSTSPR